VKYTGTWVCDHAYKQVEQRPNDTNANGDCPATSTHLATAETY